MKSKKEKDALTDLVEITAPADVSSQPSNNGKVTDSSGDKVTLGFKKLARKLIRTAKKKIVKEEEEVVKQQFKIRD